MFFCFAVLIAIQPVYGETHSKHPKHGISRKQNKQGLYRKHYKSLINKWKNEPDAAKRKDIEEKIERFKKRHINLFK